MMPVAHPSNPVSSPLVPVTDSLPLVGMRVTADACAGLARVVVEQRFHNPNAVPLAVTYAFPLPADAAVSGYTFVIGDRRIQGEIARREEARERFEEALLEGKSAALLEQDRTSLFTQEIGNIPPGAEVVAELVLDQPLRWLDEGCWEWRFPTAAAPRYLGGPGESPDAARVAIAVADAPPAARTRLALTVRDRFKDGARVESPSHALVATRRGDGEAVELADPGGAPLDRDLVVRWKVAGLGAGFTVDLGRAAATSPVGHDAFGLCTLVPPVPSPTARPVARDLIVLLDTSGSMAGEPLDQARRVVSALIDTLSDRDQLELIEFSNQARRWKRKAVAATAQHREEALAWLARLSASGSTEMRTGITEAMATLRPESQRQIVLVTDGQIGFEEQVVAELTAHLPRGTRLHTVGVGSAVNRSLTGPAARAGRGVEVIVGLGEDPERAARRIVARTASPLVVDVVLEGSALLEHAPARLGDLFAGAPLLVSVRLRASGGELQVRGRTADGPWEARLALPPMDPASGSAAVVTLFGRERVEDLELAHSGERAVAVDARVERLGLDFSIATRMTSWVAVSDVATVDPRDPTRRQRIPQALPHGMSVAGLGLRGAGAPMASLADLAVASFGATAGFVGSFPPGAAGRAVPAPSAPRPAAGRPMNAPPRAASKPRASAVASAPSSAAPPPPPAGFAAKKGAGPRGEEAAARTAVPLTLSGRVVSSKAGTIVLEIVADADGLVWDPADLRDVVLVSADGARMEGTVQDSKTTRAATLQPGESARLTVEVADGGLGWAVQVLFRLGQRLVLVNLSP